MNRRLLLFVILCLTVLAAACQRAPQKTSEIPRVLSHQYSVAVMPFTQPTDACELIMGRIPEGQGCISAGEMGLLDADLKELLLSKKNARPYTFEGAGVVPAPSSLRFRAGSQPQALPAWAKLARRTGKDFILVPQIIDWHEREGSQAGVTRPASVHLEFFLIRSQSGTVQNHVVYDEEQVGLVNNLLTVNDFVKRKGAWVTARSLAREGMEKMVKELGL